MPYGVGGRGGGGGSTLLLTSSGKRDDTKGKGIGLGGEWGGVKGGGRRGKWRPHSAPLVREFVDDIGCMRYATHEERANAPLTSSEVIGSNWKYIVFYVKIYVLSLYIIYMRLYT